MAMAIDTPQTLVERTSNSFLKALKDQKNNIEKNPEILYRLVENIILPHMDMSRISAWVLGKHWRKANARQKQLFIEQFRLLLIRTYSTAMLNYSNLDISYLPVQMRNKDTRATVRAKITSPGGLIVPVNYNLYSDKGHWKLYDIQVDGISLISTYRSSFSRELRRLDMDTFIQRLTEQNSKVVASSETLTKNN
jgi:phospholipid transport system substrate-binding protein